MLRSFLIQVLHSHHLYNLECVSLSVVPKFSVKEPPEFIRNLMISGPLDISLHDVFELYSKSS